MIDHSEIQFQIIPLLVCLSSMLNKITRFFCSTPHTYTVNQTSTYSSCTQENLCNGGDCTDTATQNGYLLSATNKNLCSNLAEVVSFKDTTSSSTLNTYLAVGDAKISALRANSSFVELETMGYCSTSSCNCGASLPLYLVEGYSGSTIIDYFYTLSTQEVSATNGTPGVYYQHGQGVQCYLWRQDATETCGTYC